MYCIVFKVDSFFIKIDQRIMKMIVCILLIIGCMRFVEGYNSIPPSWTSCPYVANGNYLIISAKRNGSDPMLNRSLVFTKTFNMTPNIAYGIKQYVGNDRMGEQFFEIVMHNSSATQFTVGIKIYGFTNFLKFSVAYIAIDYYFPHHVTSFANLAIYYGSTLSNINNLNNSVRSYTNTINYTALCIAQSKFYNVLPDPLSETRILNFITAYGIATNHTTDVPNFSLKVVYTVLTNQTFSVSLTINRKSNVSDFRSSLIFFNLDDIKTSGKYLVVFGSYNYGVNGGNATIDPIFASSFMMGLSGMEMPLTTNGVIYQWDFTNSSTNIRVYASIPANYNSSLTGSLNATYSTYVYFKHSNCATSPYLYFNVTSELCQDNCTTGYFANSTYYTCDLCNDTCVECDNFTHCSVCNASQFRQLTNTTYGLQCLCSPGYYQINNSSICLPCAAIVANCSSCSIVNNTLACTACSSNSALVNSTNCQFCDISLLLIPVNGTCSCIAGYYWESGLCNSCSSNITDCTSCSISNGSVSCNNCSTGLLLVNNSSCFGCNATLFLEPTVGPSCKCMTGYYLHTNISIGCDLCVNLIPNCISCLDNNSTVVCQACSNTSYLLNSTFCNFCNITQFYEVDGLSCKCITGYFLDPAGPTCTPCSPTITDCLQCSINATMVTCTLCTNTTTLLDNRICQYCDPSNFLVAAYLNGTAQCVCMPGYYLHSNNSCVLCSNTIGQCNLCSVNNASVVECNNCSNTSILTTNGSCFFCNNVLHQIAANISGYICVCISGYYHNPNTSMCETCSTAISLCAICSFNGTDVECSNCSGNSTLFNNSVCLSCNSNQTPIYGMSGPQCVCNLGYYMNTSNHCLSCSSLIPRCVDCSEVNSTVLCNSCLNNSYLIAGLVCQLCTPANFMEMVNGSCQCMAGHFLNIISESCEQCHSFINNCEFCSFDGISVNCTGCSANATLFNNTVCLLCNSSLLRQPTYTASGPECTCMSGYYEDPSTFNCVPCSNAISNCSQCTFVSPVNCSACTNGTSLVNNFCSQSIFCGDGILGANEQCDDGNNLPNDGCSADCHIENSFGCVGSPSCCTLKNLSIIEESIYKNPTSNQVTITFDFGMEIPSYFSNSNITVMSNSSSFVSISNSYFDANINKMIVTISYSKNMDKKNILFMLTIATNNTCSTSFSTTTLVNMVANNNIPVVYYQKQQYEKLQSFQKAWKAAEYLSYAIMVVSLFSCKIVGVQLFGVLQLAFFVIADLDNVNILLMPLMKMKQISGLNIHISAIPSSTPDRVQSLGYDADFLNNCNIMIFVVFAWTIVGTSLLFASRFTNSWNGKLYTFGKHMLKQFLLTLILFNVFNISFSVGLHFTYSKPNYPLHTISSIAAVFSLLFLLGVSVALQLTDPKQFGEFKNKMKPGLVNQSYFLVMIAYRMLLGYNIAAKNQYYLATMLIIMAPIMYLIYNFANLPFKDAYQNYRANFCHVSQTIILFITMYYRSMKGNDSIDETSKIYNPIYVEILAIFLTIIISALALSYEIYLWIKQISSKKTSPDNAILNNDSYQAKKIRQNNQDMLASQQNNFMFEEIEQ